MICTNCNHECDDKYSFCPNCGYNIKIASQASNEHAPFPDPASEEVGRVPQANNAFQNGASCNEEPYVENERSPSPENAANLSPQSELSNSQQDTDQTPQVFTKRKKSKKPYIVALTSILLVIAITVASAIVFDMKRSPLEKIAKAVINTYEAGSLSSDFEFSQINNYEGGKIGESTIKGSLEAQWDREEREITFYLEFQIDDNSEYIVALYDEKIIYYEKYRYISGDTKEQYSVTDISDTLDDFFDAVEDNQETFKDVEPFSEEFFDLLFSEMDDGDDAYDKFKDVFHVEKIQECFENISALFMDESWLEENLGFETYKDDGIKYYSFSPKFEKIVKSLGDEVEPIFKDEDYYNNLYESLVAGAETIDKEISDLTYYTGIKGGKIASIGLNSADENNDEISCTITFSDVGKTTIDNSKLEQFLTKAKEYEKNH